MSRFKLPNTYVIIAGIIILCAVLTWFVPGGQYVKADDGTLSYETVSSVPQTWQVFTAIYHGFVKQAGIIIFILVVGGAFWLLNATGAVEAGIKRFIVRIGKRDKLVLVALTVLFSLAGAVFELRAAEDIVGKEGTVFYKKDDLVEKLTTSKTGSVKSKILPLGKYYLVEVSGVPDSVAGGVCVGIFPGPSTPLRDRPGW